MEKPGKSGKEQTLLLVGLNTSMLDLVVDPPAMRAPIPVSLREDEVTRHHYFHQLKMDVVEGRIRCNNE